MLTIVEYPDRARCARYAVYLCGIVGDRALLAEGPTQEIAMDDAIAYVRDSIRDPKCLVSYDTEPRAVREVLAAFGPMKLDRALTPVEYVAKYADRAPWPSPEKVYR